MLEELIASILSGIQLPPSYHDGALVLLSHSDPESKEAHISTRRDTLLADLERCKHAFKMGVSDQAEFDADVRRIRHELDVLPVVATVEERRLTLEEAARSLQEMRALWSVATRTEQRAVAQSLFWAVHVDLDGQTIATVELASCFRDLLPFVGTPVTSEEQALREQHTPAAQCARESMFGRKRRDSNPRSPA